MGNFRNLTGERFGRLLVLEVAKAPSSSRERRKWLCRCDCGRFTQVLGGNLTSGKTRSCGCLKHEIRGAFQPNQDRLYNSWRAMKGRCLNPRNNRYYRYGGRGITICPEWMDFAAFSEWALQNGYAPDLTIDRIDVDGNYCPENCRWIPPEKQAATRGRKHEHT